MTQQKFKMVPTDPPESQWDGLPRDLFLAFDMGCKSGDAVIEYLGHIGTEIPESVLSELKGKGHLTKGDRAVIVYKAMLASAPDVESEAVAWVKYRTTQWFGTANGIGEFSFEKRDDFKYPLYTTPQPFRTAELEDKVKRLVEADAATEKAWLVERDIGGIVNYLHVDCTGLFGWTPANSQAMRFSRRKDALMICDIITDYTRVAEHVWHDALLEEIGGGE